MRRASASRPTRLITGVITSFLLSLLSVFAFGGQAGAWDTPTLNANCAPDAAHFAWTIDLHTEKDQKIEMGWGTGASFIAFQTTDFVTAGVHTFTTARAGNTLTVRYASDRNVKTSATATSAVCGSGTTSGGVVAGSQQNTSGGTNSGAGASQTCGPAKLLSHGDISWTQGGQATVSFTMGAGCTGRQLSLVSYTAPSDTFSRDNASQQRIFQAETGTFGDQTGSHTYVLQVNVPSCFFQIDFVSGSPITQLGPAGSNNFYSDQDRLLAGVNGGTMSCSSANTTGGSTIPQTVTPGMVVVSSPAAPGSTPRGTTVAGFQTAPAVGSVTPVIELPGGSNQQSPNGVPVGTPTGVVAGVQSLPSTSTSDGPPIPLATGGLALMALGGILLRRREVER